MSLDDEPIDGALLVAAPHRVSRHSAATPAPRAAAPGNVATLDNAAALTTVDDPVAAVTAFPRMPRRTDEGSVRDLLRVAGIQCQRVLNAWARDKTLTMQAIAYPALTLLMFDIVLGNQVSAHSSVAAIYGTAPMMALIAVMSGSMLSASALQTEAREGLLTRFRAMPLHRASLLLGRVAADTIRVIVTTIVLFATGMAMGLRFLEGPQGAAWVLFIAVLYGIGFSMFVSALALLSGNAPLLDIVGVVMMLLMFFNTGFVPLEAYPGWLQPIVGNQPMSCGIDAMKAALVGGDVLAPTAKILAWTVVVLAICTPLTIRGSHAATTR